VLLICFSPLLQAQQTHGSKWTFIASEYLPWRSPQELKSVCHSKSLAGWEASNRYIEQDYPLDWLLENRTSDFKQLWGNFKSNGQAAAQVR
jgi:hypothetical protein